MIGPEHSKGENGNGALSAEVYAFEIDVHGWLKRLWWCIAQDELVDKITDLLRCINNLCFDFPLSVKDVISSK